jgi:hypothetical protein
MDQSNVTNRQSSYNHASMLTFEAETIYLDNERMMEEFISRFIPEFCVVAFNGNTQKIQDVRNALLKKQARVYFSWDGKSANRSMDTFEELEKPDVIVTSSEAALLLFENSKRADLNYSEKPSVLVLSSTDRFEKDKKIINEIAELWPAKVVFAIFRY